MILYILKSIGCLALLLFFYHLLLEREKMHNFNRFYLLGSILFSFLAPLATITVDKVMEEAVIVNQALEENLAIIDNTTPVLVEETLDYSQLFLGIYILISCVFLIRFGRNLFKIIQKIKQNELLKHRNAILVLVDDKILPHTFWKYIFINKKDYLTHKIEEELFTHELTHVTQKHTFDVLFIELLQGFFWINPLFIFLKKSIQLNHEFLADESVINQYKNTSQYQYLLLNKAAWNNEYYLASNLNYSLTKKRLEMMTTQSSPIKILLKKLMVIPLLVSFIFLFAERVEAQEKQENIETQEVLKDDTELSESELYKKYVYRNLTTKRKNKNGKYVIKTYNELNDEEKKRLMPPPPLKLKKILPTETQFEALKDKSKFAVWIDGKVVDNKILNNYQYTDFARYSNSHVYKNARSKRFPQEYQASLETTKYFEAQNKKRVKDFELYKENKKKLAKTKWQILPNGEKIKVIEGIKNNTLKKEYIDSPIQRNKQSSKQSVPKDIPFMTTTIKAEKETNVGTVTDIRLKLKDVGALKISYLNDTISKKTSATKAQVKEYESIVSKRKKTDIFKVKEINKLKKIYTLMSNEQKKSVINVNDFIKTIPVVIPKINWVFTYNRLASKVKRTSDNRKANLIYLKEIYHKKMSDKERKKVTTPDKILPPPPPRNHLDKVIRMAKVGTKFYYEGKLIHSDKAIELLKKNRKLIIHFENTNYNNSKVWISR